MQKRRQIDNKPRVPVQTNKITNHLHTIKGNSNVRSQFYRNGIPTGADPIKRLNYIRKEERQYIEPKKFTA